MGEVMAVSVMPGTRGSVSCIVPQPKPKYAPAGHHRCESCNALVRDGKEHVCHIEPHREPQPVRVSHIEPQRTQQPKKRKPNWRSLYRCESESDDKTLFCSVCGSKYKDSQIGKISKMCPKCRKSKSQGEA